MEVKREKDSLGELVGTVRRLRAPGGCPWDRAQTHESLVRYLLEETYEVLDAIERGSAPDLREELGDLLLQILLHAEIEREAGRFDISSVAADETDKMVRRHPHVFGNASAEETLASWEQSKSLEKQRRTLLERLSSVPRALPALLRAQKLLDKCDGYLPGEALADPAHIEGILFASGVENADGEVEKVRLAGEYLLSAVAAFRGLGIDCEAALSKANQGVLAKCKEREKTS